MAKDAIGFALSALNRLAGSSMLDRLGMRHTAERLAYRLTKGGFQVITTSARAFKSNNPSTSRSVLTRRATPPACSTWASPTSSR